jgi:ubiquinone/menaquinone biosynthesis C-methylase UbiE
MVDRNSQMGLLMQHYVGYIATHLIRLGADSGIFAALATHREGLTGEELGVELGYDACYAEHYLRAACAAELVDYEESGGRFRLAPHMSVLLAAPENHRYMANLAHLYILAGRDFGYMEDYLKTGAINTFQDHDEQLIVAASNATEGIAQFLARAVVPRLPGIRNRDDVQALDVGCGAGAVVVALAKAFPFGHVVGIDIEPRLVERATKRIAEAGVQARAEARIAAAESLDEDGAFDLVTMVQVLHETKQEARDLILSGVYRALRPEGILAVVDEPYPNTLSLLRDAPAAVLTQFVEAFMGNVLLSPDEQKETIEAAGFSVLSQMVPKPGLICVTIAQKGSPAAA